MAICCVDSIFKAESCNSYDFTLKLTTTPFCIHYRGFFYIYFGEYSFFALWQCCLAIPVLAGWGYGSVVLCPGALEGSTGSGSGFKASQKTGQRLKVSSDRLGEAGNRTCDPWFTRHRFIPHTTAASIFSIWIKNMLSLISAKYLRMILF